VRRDIDAEIEADGPKNHQGEAHAYGTEGLDACARHMSRDEQAARCTRHGQPKSFDHVSAS